MRFSAILSAIMFIIILWGGFGFCLYKALKAKDK